ncbi:MAG: hypothetical protein RSA66_00245 [Muribaculaceae bacterium]
MKFIFKILSIILPLLLLNLVCSCSVDKIAKSGIEIKRFELDVNNYSKMSELQKNEFKQKYSDIITLLYQEKCRNSNDIDSVISNIPSTAIYKAFYIDVKNRFNSLDTLEMILTEIHNNIIPVFPAYRFPQIKSYITPYNQSVIVTDSTLLIGLNHYLGAHHPMYEYYEPYQRINKTASQIPYNVAEAIVRRNTEKIEKEKTLLEAMIYEGLVAYITKQIIPENADGNIFGYTISQEKWCKTNEKEIWRKLISQDILYSKSKMIHEQMLTPSPFTILISQDSPGAMGRWIGLQIIESYVDNNTIDNVTQLCSDILNAESQTILMKSKYEG